MPLDFSSLASDAQQYTQSEDFKKLLPYLLSGGGGALLGGVMSGERRKDREGRLGYLGRILRNAAVTGGLAAGGHYLLNKGIDKTIGKTVDEGGTMPGADSDAIDPGDPLSNTVKNVAFSPLTAAGAGGAALLSTQNRAGIGAGDTNRALNSFAKKLGLKGKDFSYLRDETPGDIGKLVGGNQEVDRLRRAAGLASDSGEGLLSGTPARSVLSKMLRTGPGSTFGQSWPRRAVRGALGLTAAGIPALIGAIATKGDQAV